MRIIKTSMMPKSNINFGYDKKFHKKFQSDMLKNSSSAAKYIASQDKFILSVEDEIVRMENHHETFLDDYRHLCNFLIDLKDALAYTITDLLPNTNYVDSLIEQYIDETEKLSPRFPWRIKLVSNISMYSKKDYSKVLSKYNIPNLPSSKKERTTEQEDGYQRIKNILTSNLQEEVKNSHGLLTRLDIENPMYDFDDVIGLDVLKTELKNDVISYLKSPQKIQTDLEEYGVTMPKALLLYGPPGCGKTMITKALAREAGAELYRIDISKIGSKYINESSNNLQSAFDILYSKARKSKKPIIVFLDEVDSLAIRRNASSPGSFENSKLTTTLLEAMEKSKEENMIIIAATNIYDVLDEAFVSRFEEQKFIGLLNKDEIKKLIVKNLSYRLKAQDLLNDKEALDELSGKLVGYSNRSIVHIIDTACKFAKNEKTDITKECFYHAIEESNLDKPDENKYRKKDKTRKIGFVFG